MLRTLLSDCAQYLNNCWTILYVNGSMIQLISFVGCPSSPSLPCSRRRPKDTCCTATAALHYTGVAAQFAAKKGGAKTLDVLITRPEDLFVGKTGREEAFNESAMRSR